MYSPDRLVREPYPEVDMYCRDWKTWIVYNASVNSSRYQMERYIDDTIYFLGKDRGKLQYFTDAEITKIVGSNEYCA